MNINDFKPALEGCYIKPFECGQCQKKEQLKNCTRCQHVRYCSRECQKSAWKTHKMVCHKPELFEIDDDGKSYLVEDWREGWTKQGKLLEDKLPVIRVFSNENKLEFALLRPYYLRAKAGYLHNKITQQARVIFVSPLFNWSNQFEKQGVKLVPIYLKPLTIESHDVLPDSTKAEIKTPIVEIEINKVKVKDNETKLDEFEMMAFEEIEESTEDSWLLVNDLKAQK